MCGIFGLLTKSDSSFTTPTFECIFNDLFLLSESRGKEAAGIALRCSGSIKVIKAPVSAHRLIKTVEYKKLFNELPSASSIVAIGHSRLVTNGAQTIYHNNQPVIKEGIVGIHNGIIVNTGTLFENTPGIRREYDIDTEIILALIKHFLNCKQATLPEAIQMTFDALEGSASIALLFNDFNYLALATNTGSLYICRNKDNTVLLFASERYILETLSQRAYLRRILKNNCITQVNAGTSLLLELSDFQDIQFSLDTRDGTPGSQIEHDSVTSKQTEKTSLIKVPITKDITPILEPFRPAEQQTEPRVTETISSTKDCLRHYHECQQKIKNLKRCTKCILPETMPFIDFDEKGVCYYCRNHQYIVTSGAPELETVVKSYRRKGGSPDCIVALSGGRDSCYALHYVKTVLKMNPIAFSYDWGMITDLARRNQARLCGKLGVEHIVVSADITQKRKYIRQNVAAWLKRPELGIIPLFMAGDKQYFYYANRLKDTTGINLLIMGENLYERSKFKTGFCNLLETNKYSYTLSYLDTLKLSFYYMKQYLRNPSYFNSSLFDTLWAFASFYFESHDYVNLYKYISWREDDIITTLKNEYNWETSDDTQSTWRIGDGTAAFYNYIYYTVAGFTENDTFRSMEVREGMRNRDEALRLAQVDNQPRWDSIQWYCDTIGIDINKTLSIINNIPKRY